MTIAARKSVTSHIKFFLENERLVTAHIKIKDARTATQLPRENVRTIATVDRMESADKAAVLKEKALFFNKYAAAMDKTTARYAPNML